MSGTRLRRIAAALCGGVGILLIVVAVLLGYARRVLFDEVAFSNRVAASLADRHVAEFVAEKIADAVLQVQPDLVGLRPILVGVGRTVVGSPPFRSAVRRGARAMHHAIMDGTGRDIVLTVKDIGLVVESAAAEQPAIARKIPPRVAAVIGDLKSLPGGERAVRLVQIGHTMRWTAVGLLLLGIAFSGGGVWLSREKRWAMVRVGVSLVAVGLLLVVAARGGPLAVGLSMKGSTSGPALTGLLRAFFLPLVVWGSALIFSGVVLASASASLLERVALTLWGARIVGWCLGRQERMRLRLLRGVIGVAAGALLLAWPIPALTALTWLAGIILLFAGLREAFYAALHMLPEMSPRTRLPDAARVDSSRRGGLLVGGVAALLLAATAWFVLRPPKEAAAEHDVTFVNGSAFLPDRTVDQVVFPCSHNSMGSPDAPGWMFPNQSADIHHQLEDGIRAFMIDVHHGVAVGDKVKTLIQDEKRSMAKYAAVLGDEGMQVAIRIRDRLVGEKEEGKPDLYMCHGLCEIGAAPFRKALEDVRDFLRGNPDEVLIFIIQDEEVSPQEVAACFDETGLVEYVYRGPLGPPWPSMRELVESNQRLIVFAENQWEGVDWYHPAFATFQETPYTFEDPSEFSNKPNRGGTGGSLYLINHWIETTPMPKPTNAELVNAHDFLLKRIDDFAKTRGHLPNLVAVDFYKSGDLVQVVRELNERPAPASEPAPQRP